MNKYFYFLIRLIISTFFLIALLGCEKKLEPGHDYTPGMALAVAHGQLSLSDMVPLDDENFSIDQDGKIHFFYREDSVVNYAVKDFFEIDVQQTHELTYELGDLELNNFGPIGAEATLENLLTVVDAATASQIEALDGTNNQVPAMVSDDSKTFDFDAFDNFEYVTFSQGWLTLGIKNNIPITFASVHSNLYTVNTQGDSVLVGSFVFYDLQPGVPQIDSIPLAGKTLYNDFRVFVTDFESYATAGAVPVNLTDGVSFELNSTDLKVSAGKAKIPAQDLGSETDSTHFSVESDERLTFVMMNEAKIVYEIESFMNVDAQITFELPSVIINGTPVKLNVSADNGTKDSLDLSGALFDLTTNWQQPYNYLPVIVGVELSGADSWVEFDTTSSFRLQYTISNIDFALAQGWVGMKEHAVEPDTIDLDFSELANLSGSVYLADPKFNLIVDNNIGLPLKFNLDLLSETDEGGGQSLMADPFYFPYPASPGEEIVDEFITLDNSNSQLSEFISLLPDKLYVGGNVTTNPDSATTGVVYNNFVTGDGRVNLDLSFELPLELSLQDIQYIDTLDFSIDSDYLDDALGGHLSIVSENGIPFETEVRLELIDSISQQVIDSYTIDVLAPAQVDEVTGKVENTTSHVAKVELSQAQILNLKKVKKAIVTALVNTTSSGSQEVVFYSDYTLDLRVGALLNYSIDID